MFSAVSAVSAFNVVFASVARAQDPLTVRAAILSAEDRRAPTARDIAAIRGGLHSQDPQTVRIAVRALGRLERPDLIPDIVPSLRSAAPEIRAEAANAIAQAADGIARRGRTGGVARGTKRAPVDPLDAAVAPLAARLKVETDSTVRSALCESLGRLPFTTAAQAARAESELLGSLGRDQSIDSELGVALGLEALARRSRTAATNDSPSPAAAASDTRIALSDAAVAALQSLVAPGANAATAAARIRRVALVALLEAQRIDSDTIRTASADADAQVRMVAARAAGTGELDAVRRSVLAKAMADDSPLVRYEAVRALGRLPADGGCASAIGAARDRNAHVALLAIDDLGACGWSAVAVDQLDKDVHNLSTAGAVRGWHRAARALVALATAAPGRATAALGQFTGSTLPWLRMYGARAAARLTDRAALERLASDPDDNVRDAAISGLEKVAGHDADQIYVAQLGRADPQLVRTAALALAGTPRRDAAVPALRAALQRLTAEGRDTARDARVAIAETLRDLGVVAAAPPPVEDLRPESAITAAELRRLQGARARITVRGLGAFDLALITTEAPASVIRFAQLAARGYYDGLTFHRVVPNFVIQGGSPGANEYAGDATYMRDEVGLWPHVRGAVGVSTRGHDTGDAQIFIDLVDNPRLDHVYTVFAQVLNGMDIVDQILEGDVIERVEILAGS